MNREEIRKKWKNRELAEVSQNKLARQEETQNPNLYKQTFGLGNINLRNRPVVKNSDGSISTVRSMSFYDDDEKKEILVPTVVGGKIVSDREAIDNYYKTGQYLGKFDTPEEATDYALKLHDAQDKYYNKPNVQQTSINSSSWERVQNMANQIMTRNRELVNVQNPLLNQRLQKNNALQDFSNTQRKFNENDVKNKTNKEKNILSKGKDYAGEIGRSLGFGIVEPFANIGSMAYNFPTKLGNALGLETVQQRNAKMGKGISPEEFTDTVKEIENLENERVSQLGTGLRTASRWSRVIGNMIPSILIGQGLAVGNTPEAIQKSASAISSFTSALNSGASTYNETLNEEQDNFLKAGLKASLYGLATKKIEGITGGNIINKFGSLDDIATKGISKVAKNELQKKILSSVYAALGETGEENLENWTDHLIDYAFGDAKDITAQSLLEEAKQTSIDTTAVNFIMQLLGMGGGTYNDVKLYEAEQKIDSANFLNENQKSAMKEVLQENGNPNVADYLLANQLQKVQQNQATTTPNNEILNQEQQTIQEESKQAQNRLSQETEENKQEVIKKQEITEKNYENIVENAKYISKEEKNNLKDYIKNLDKNDTTLNDFKNFVNEMNNNSKEVYDNILNTTETYSTGRKEKYQKYLKSKTNYDNSALKNALDIIPANNQGRRTKEQWLNVAKQIGTEIANKSNQEIEEIAFRAWQDERPSSKESMNRQGNKFVPFNSDEWINAIYDSVNEQRQYSVDTEQQAENQTEQQENKEKTVQEISKKRNKKNEEIKNETQFNKLTKEQEQKIKAIKDDLERRKKYISLQADKQMAGKKIKGLSMQASAEIRKIIQGDYLIPVEGGLTNIELKNRIEYLRSNYKGKKVIVNDKQGTIIGNAYGKVGVKFEDGTQKYLDKKFIKPVENIDEIINKQAQKNQTEQQAENQAEQQGNVERQAQQNQQPVEQTVEEEKTRKKILNPTEISNLKLEDANTTPELKDKKYKKGTKESNFAENIENDVGFLTEEQKKEILKDDNVKYYAPVTNADTLAKAFNNLNENGQNATYEWYAKPTDNATAEDVATGWILLKQYADKGDTQGMVNVAKKMRDMGTKAGQTVQAFNILSRLTPEGMVAYTQGELQDAYNEMVKGKTKKWIEQHKGDFDLSQEEVAFIMDTMQNLPVENPDTNNYERKVALGQIQKIFTDKIPSEGGKIKAWMRISMLFNPKTQVRNVAGNVGIVPVNAFSDFLGSKVDAIVAKKTGVRTLGNPNVKSYLKGAGQGLYQSYNDFKLGINTRGIEGSKFEFGEGNSFNNKGLGKALNRTENILNFVMDAGDRAFSQGSFVNSLNNQMVLNGVDTPTQEMIDIATQEALSRTWNDDNEYTRFVLGIRNGLNKVGTKSYGLGDVLIPFAKTPANLTKAIVDYSPVGLVNAIKEGNNLKNAIETGQFTAMQQHKFVDDLGKALAGTMLYVIGYALAKAGIATGEADDDKDVKNFMKNSLGINSYSIKIGDKSFTYDWAQPVATPIAIMTNLNKVNKENPDASTLEKALNAVNIGTNQIMEQSFMESLNEVLNGNGEITERIQKALLDLPARAVPTFSKQIADLVDSTQRTSFEYGKPLQSSINAVKAKIPFASKTLTPVVDTLGNEVKRYGGENNLFNVFLNPSNMNKGQLSQAGKEIYNVYMQTGDTKVFPVTAPYYINYKGDKITMTSKQKADYQRIAGKYTEEVIKKLLSNDSYNSLTNEEKAEVLTNVVNDSNSKAKKDVLNIENKNSNIDLIEKIGSNYYTFKVDLKNALDKKRQETGKETATLNDSESISVLQQGNYSKKEKDLIYKNIINDKDDVYDNLKLLDNNSLACVDAYFDYKTSDFSNDREDDGTAKGKAITGTGRNKLKNFLNSFSNSELTPMQKLYLVGVNNSSLNANERAKLKKYIYSLNITEEQRKKIESKLKFTTEMSDGTISWKYN